MKIWLRAMARPNRFRPKQRVLAWPNYLTSQRMSVEALEALC